MTLSCAPLAPPISMSTLSPCATYQAQDRAETSSGSAPSTARVMTVAKSRVVSLKLCSRTHCASVCASRTAASGAAQGAELPTCRARWFMRRSRRARSNFSASDSEPDRAGSVPVNSTRLSFSSQMCFASL